MTWFDCWNWVLWVKVKGRQTLLIRASYVKIAYMEMEMEVQQYLDQL